MLKKTIKCDRLSIQAAIFLTAVLEYMIADILDLAINLAVSKKKHRITAKIIAEAIQNDLSFCTLFDRNIFIIFDKKLDLEVKAEIQTKRMAP